MSNLLYRSKFDTLNNLLNRSLKSIIVEEVIAYLLINFVSKY